MDIYIKPVKKAVLAGRGEIAVGDVAEVVADGAGLINKLPLINAPPRGGKRNYLIKCTDIIRVIKAAFPDASVINVGEKDTVLTYSPRQEKERPLLTWAKVALVSLMLVTGSATAIMSFHTDAQIPKVFEKYREILCGGEKGSPLLITIPYSVGLAVSIAVFYNHALGKRLSDDPTPLEVEMNSYENKVTGTLADALGS